MIQARPGTLSACITGDVDPRVALRELLDALATDASGLRETEPWD